MELHVCTRCGAVYEDSVTDPGWRVTPDGVEHACPGLPPQCGHFPARVATLAEMLAAAEMKGRAAADSEWLAAVDRSDIVWSPDSLRVLIVRALGD